MDRYISLLIMKRAGKRRLWFFSGVVIFIVILYVMSPNNITNYQAENNHVKDARPSQPISSEGDEWTYNDTMTTETPVKTTVHEEAQGVNDCHVNQTLAGDWSMPELPTHLHDVAQNNPELVYHICKHWIVPPFPSSSLTLYQKLQTFYSQYGQDMIVDRILGNKTGGFYIEAGVGPGEGLSNTLFFERQRGWNGLLVEPDEDSFRSILRRRRHAYTIQTCLSPTMTPQAIMFSSAGVISGLPEFMDDEQKNRIDAYQNITVTSTMQCLPLYSILSAIHVTHVDYFSLDVEGPELPILYTLPLDKITVDVFSIEYFVNKNATATKEKLAAITEYLVNQHGYEIVVTMEVDVILRKRRT